MASGVFTGLDAAVMNGLNSVLQGQMSLYSSMMAGLVTGSATLYILWRGYQTLAGKLHTPVEDVAWDLARMGIILAFVTNADGYLDAAIAAINGLKDGFSGNENVWVLLDTLWVKAQALGSKLMSLDNSTYVKSDGAIGELLVWIGSMFTLIVATIVNLGAELTLLLMTTTAPIFIFCLIYGFLRPMFNNWLQTIFSGILTLMFSALSLRIVIDYLGDVLNKATTLAGTSNIVTLGAQACLAGVGAGIVVWFSAKIAGALAGAAVAGVIQGAAKMGMMTSARKVANTAGRIGNSAKPAAERLEPPVPDKAQSQTINAKASAKAAVEKMKAQN